jgi:hypothetical protein
MRLSCFCADKVGFVLHSDELKVIPQRIQGKKLNKLMLEFASGVYTIQGDGLGRNSLPHR